MDEDENLEAKGGAPPVARRMPKVAKVKNKAPAPMQITAEQLLREAKERELEKVPPPPTQKIQDQDELRDYQLRKRKAFEDEIRKNRTVMSNWIKYAVWEESQREIQRMRSVFERALDVDHRNITIWLKYAEMEMKNKQVNHARNVWDRAVTILPRANQFWYKYTYMEEMLGNVAGARNTFERWMEWEPEEQAWHSYINFELRYKELDRARAIYERFVMTHPAVKNWIKYARFEEKNHYIISARSIYERAVEFYGEDRMDEELFIAFAKFEENQKVSTILMEHDRARVIYQYALKHIPKELCAELYKQYTIHEKKFGDRAAIEDVIVSKRRFQYENEIEANPHNYDVWFDYLRLMEAEGDKEATQEIYERAIANIPPSKNKRHWRRYIYLWINYALWCELDCEDPERTEQVYKWCLEIIPHKVFTFAKVWLLYAQWAIRQKNLNLARKILGTSIGKCPKTKLFRGYIDLEIQLREFDRCRILYEKLLEFSPENCSSWIKYAELEAILGDVDRVRAIFELAINQPRLDMPEVLWKAYIDFEIEQEEYDRVRDLYNRLLERTRHVKVWISFALFERGLETDFGLAQARSIFRRGNEELKKAGEKEERVMLLESWKTMEEEEADEVWLRKVADQMPRKVKKRRKAVTEDGTDAGWEEYYDYIFPDDEVAAPSLKLLALAKQWKKAAPADGEEEEEEEESEEEESGEEEEEGSDGDEDAGEAIEETEKNEEESAGKKDKNEDDADTDLESSSEEEEEEGEG